MEITTALVVEVLAAVVLLWYWLRRPRRLSELGDKFPGRPTLPIIGNMHQLGTNMCEFLQKFTRMSKDFHGRTFRVWLGNTLYVALNTPSDLEIVMGSYKNLDKGESYDYMRPWLGFGLLTSTGAKWRHSRKILTPTFHFKILEEFVDVFVANGEILIECLQDKVGGPGFDIHHFITLNALDNICESALGIKINAQKQADSEYVKSVRNLSDIAMKRSVLLWFQNDLIFKLSGLEKKQDKALSIVHGTTERVIKSRREAIIKERPANGDASQVSEDGRKRRLAFLDLMIQSTYEGSGMTDENIREEVDTFMFEGHDTTAAAITYTIWMLCWNQDIQDAVYHEVKEVWPESTESITYQQLQELKLLERVIKETLRLYPSVPLYTRKFVEDTVLSGGLVAPKGADAAIPAYAIHRNPDIFPDPEKFDPNRFLPENVLGRHPYAYIPFSAGPRNCIGQKFAMLEMKCTLVQVLNKYKFSPAAPTQELKLFSDMILTAKDGVPVTIEPRSV